MKNKPLLPLTLAIVLLSACSDDDENKEACYECTVIMKTSGSGVNDTITSKIEQCGLTADEADQVEKTGTNTTTSTSGGITVTIRNTTTCIKK